MRQHLTVTRDDVRRMHTMFLRNPQLKAINLPFETDGETGEES